MSAFSTPRVDPRMADLKIKEYEWMVIRRTQITTLADYAHLSWIRAPWTVTDNGSIIARPEVREESPIFKRTAHYHNVRRAINRVRAEALTSMTR